MVSGASPAYNVDEMTYTLKIAKAKLVATSPASMAVAVKAAANTGIPREHIFLREGNLEGFTSIKELIEIGKNYKDDQVPSFKIPSGMTNFDICGFLSFRSEI